MSIRRLLLAVLGVVLVLAVVGRQAGYLGAADEPRSAAHGTVHEGSKSDDTEEPAVERAIEHDPFEEIEDSFHWLILHTLGIEFHLPHWAELEGVVLCNGISKFMILELIAAGLIAGIYIPLARRLQRGEPPSGAWDNAFEGMLVFIRDEVAKPNLGEHDADRYTPFLWTLFLFVLFNNLLGMFPYMGSPTANLYCTGGLALISFAMMHAAAIAKMGPLHYLKSLWPHMDVPFGMGYFLKPMICGIELVGTVIKGGVLAVRLFANMFAGHTVLAMILSFIIISFVGGAGMWLWGSITAASVLGVVALSFLELFVAFLQSYIFVFLTSLFMGMALHPQH